MIEDINLPAIEPVSLQSAKAFLRVDHDNEDELIIGFIQSARQRIETYLSVSLITRRRLFTKVSPKSTCLYLNHHPIKRVISVDTRLGQQTQKLDPSDYLVNLHARPASLRLLKNNSLQADAIQVEIEAGFGESADEIPMPFRQAILLLIAQSYEHRGDEDMAMPMMVDALLMPYRGLRL